MSRANGEWKREGQRQWYLKNREISIERSKDWHKNNRERSNKWKRDWSKRNPLKIKAHGWKSRGINLEPAEFQRMLDLQRGLCAICSRPQTTQRLGVDHNHETGRIRSLLCTRCNVQVGWVEQLFGPDRIKLRTILRYLKKYNL